MPDMGTKTADETGAETGTEAKTDEEKVDVTKTDEATEAESASAPEDTADDELDAEDGDELPEAVQEEGPVGVGQGAAAVVSVALGLVSLTGGWIGSVAAQKESLLSQLQNSSQSASVSTLLKEGYGDVWNVQALYGGVFALVALLVGVFVLVRPAFGAPGKPQAGWIKSVSWAGVSLGVVGLLIAVLKYADVLVSLPSAS